MNLLKLVGPRLDNIYQIRRKLYYSSDRNFFQSKQGPGSESKQVTAGQGGGQLPSPSRWQRVRTRRVVLTRTRTRTRKILPVGLPVPACG
jgi:hypothetical protein